MRVGSIFYFNSKKQMKEKWITMKQAAALVGVTDITIKNWIIKGLLSFQNNHRCFRVDRNQVIEVAKRKTELCEAIRSVDEALSAYKEERELYVKEANNYHARIEGLRSIILEKKKIDSRFEWTMNTISELYIAMLSAWNENEKPLLPSRSTEALYSLLTGQTIDDIAQNYGVTVESIRQRIRKAIICVWKMSDTLHHKYNIKELRKSICDFQEEVEQKQKEIESLQRKLYSQQEAEDHEDISESPYTIIEKKLVEFNLSLRCLHCLKIADIETVRDLVIYNKFDLLRFRNMGKKTLCELDDLLESLKLRFGMSENDIEEYLSTDKDYKFVCTESFVSIASMELSKAIPELEKYDYLYDEGFRIVLDMIKVKDSFTFRNITGLNDNAMSSVILFMRKNNLYFDTRIRTSDYRKYFPNNKKFDMDDFD